MMVWLGELLGQLFRPAAPDRPLPPKPMPVDYFLEALAVTTGHAIEGGYANHPKDRGGPTMIGVTQKTYDSWRMRHGHYTRSVSQSTPDERTAIAREHWDEAHSGELPRRLAIAHFDTAFNSSPARAIRMLQQVLGVSMDGVWGPQTARAVAVLEDDPYLVREYLLVRDAFYTAIVMSDPTQAAFIAGWMNRIELLRERLEV